MLKLNKLRVKLWNVNLWTKTTANDVLFCDNCGEKFPTKPKDDQSFGFP